LGHGCRCRCVQVCAGHRSPSLERDYITHRGASVGLHRLLRGGVTRSA
jgi:hypothetical protein